MEILLLEMIQSCLLPVECVSQKCMYISIVYIRSEQMGKLLLSLILKFLQILQFCTSFGSIAYRIIDIYV